jgi:hypothetical protein
VDRVVGVSAAGMGIDEADRSIGEKNDEPLEEMPPKIQKSRRVVICNAQIAYDSFTRITKQLAQKRLFGLIKWTFKREVVRRFVQAVSVPNHHGVVPLQLEIPDHNPVLALNPSVGLKFPAGFGDPVSQS